MSTCDTTLALAVPRDCVAAGTNLASFTNLYDKAAENIVYTASRNDALHCQLESICARSAHGAGLYLLKDFAILSGAEITQAAAQLCNLLSEIDGDPEIVRVATRSRHHATTTVLAEGFAPLPVQMMYPGSATIENGWVYHYAKDEVRAILSRAVSAKDPQPDFDDDGQSLQYLFGLLKSHLSLLQTAGRLDLTFIYGKPSEGGG